MLGFSRSTVLFPTNFGHIGEFFREFDEDVCGRPDAVLRHFNVDIEDKGDHLSVTADLPGIASKDINVTVDNGVLTIAGQRAAGSEQKGEDFYLCERCCGKFSRSFRVSGDIDDEGIKADLRNGVLSLVLPRKEEAKPKKIEISSNQMRN